jgi:hypothetical protein
MAVSCSPARQSQGSAGTGKSMPETSPFGTGFTKALFKASLDVRENHLSGFLMVKRTSDTSIRMVFANEIGMTLFDLEFVDREFIAHYVLDAMNKKAFVNILRQDFRVMLFSLGKRSETLTGGGSLFGRYIIESEHGADGFPSRITIANPGIRLTFRMNLINR